MEKIRQYRPVQGDTWESVSYKLYGSSNYAYNLIEYNPNSRAIEYFDGTEVLNYPKISDSEKQSSNLPPWRES